jgi:hypothetical protein
VLLEESAATRLGKWRDKVGTRTGAASWIKHKMTQEPPGVEGFTNAPLSHHDSAEDMAYQLACRWNVAVHTVADDYRGSLSGLTGDGPPTTCQQQYPERRHAGPLDLYFNDIPPLPDLPAWTWNVVLAALSSGAPGLDGWSTKTIKDTDIISQNYLLLLLEEADKGRWPRFWNDARVVAIPKPGSTERRPSRFYLYSTESGHGVPPYTWANGQTAGCPLACTEVGLASPLLTRCGRYPWTLTMQRPAVALAATLLLTRRSFSTDYFSQHSTTWPASCRYRR